MKLYVKEKQSRKRALPCWFVVFDYCGRSGFKFAYSYAEQKQCILKLKRLGISANAYPTRSNGLPLQEGDCVYFLFGSKLYQSVVARIEETDFAVTFYSTIQLGGIAYEVAFNLKDIEQSVFF